MGIHEVSVWARLATGLLVASVVGGCGDDATIMPGDDAPPGQVTRIDTEPAGGNCPQGGTAIRTGVDDDGDGVLDDAETDATQYVCGVVTSDVYDGSVSEETWSDPAAMAQVDNAKVITGDVWFIGEHTHPLPRLEQILGGLSLSTLPAEEPLPAVQGIVGGVGATRLPAGQLTFPALRRAGAGIAFHGSPGLALSLPVLVDCGTVRVEAGGLARLDVPLLQRIDGDARLCEAAALDASSLAVVTGDATLCTSPAAALDHLVSVGGDLTVGGGGLVLPAIREIGGSLVAWLAQDQPSPGALTMAALEHIGGEMKIGGAELKRIDLPSLRKVNRSVLLVGLPKLEVLDLATLTFVGIDDLGQWEGQADRQVSIFETGLTAIDLPLLGAPVVGGSEAYVRVHIAGNPRLETLSIAQMTDAEWFEVDGNPALRVVHAPALRRVQWLFAVKRNAAMQEMDIAITQASRVEIGPMPAASVANLRGLVEADQIDIHDTGIVDLTGLAALRQVNMMTIAQSPQLTSLHGLEAVAIEKRLWLEENPALTSLDGLTVPRDFEPSLVLIRNDALTSVRALAGVERMTGALVINESGALVDLAGLESLRSAAGVELAELPRITSLAPLAHLEEVGSLFLFHLDGLATLTELSALRTISSRLVVDRCGGLTSLAGVSAAVALDFVEISYNDRLTSLAGLEQLTSVASDLNLVGNGALVDLAGLAALTHVGRDVRIDQDPLLTADMIATFLHQLGR